MIFQDTDEFESQTFKKIILNGEEIRGKSFEDCTFEHCSFQETSFTACKFQHCSFDHCDLHLLKVKDTRFREVTFSHCQASGVNWSAAAPTRLISRAPLRFISCGLNYATFIGMALKGLQLRDCVAREVDFSEANLENADCRGTDFSNSRFQNTNLTGADFRGARNYLISATANTLKRTRFSLPEAIGLLHGLDILLDDDEG